MLGIIVDHSFTGELPNQITFEDNGVEWEVDVTNPDRADYDSVSLWQKGHLFKRGTIRVTARSAEGRMEVVAGSTLEEKILRVKINDESYGDPADALRGVIEVIEKLDDRLR